MITLAQSYTAIAPNLTSSFAASGGTAPYVYSVRPGGTGGTINSSTGLYTAPAVVSENPLILYDMVQVKDNVGAIAVSSILVGTPLLLFCEIIQNQMNLPNGRVYLWDQKITEPSDSGLFIAVSLLSLKPFGNNNFIDSNGNQNQSVNINATLSVDIISRGPEARDKKELVILAFQSVYAQQQQEANSFYIGKISTSFANLSEVDGAAIPYRYNISVQMQYFVTMVQSAEYFNTFATTSVTTEA